MSGLAADPAFEILEKKYLPYLELHGIKEIFGVFYIRQTLSNDVANGKLIWHPEYDLPIDLKKDILKIFHRHFKD